MKKIMLLPVLRFGNKTNSITIRTAEIYSRIDRKSFEFYLNFDMETFTTADQYYRSKISKMHLVQGYAGNNLLKVMAGLLNTIRETENCGAIIDASEYYVSVLYSYFIHLITGKPLLMTVNIIHSGMRKRWSFEGLVCRWVFKRCSGFLILKNEEVLKEFRQIYGMVERIQFISNGIDVEGFYCIENKEFDMLFIGIIEDRKGAFLLPGIVDEIRRTIPDVRMMVISHSGELSRFREQVAAMGLGSNITMLTEYIEEEKKREILAKSRVFVFPSKEEGISIALIEALASSLPAVLFDTPSMERYSHGTLKAQPASLNEYTSMIQQLLVNEEMRVQLGKEARKFAEDEFSFDKVAEQEDQAIKKIIESI